MNDNFCKFNQWTIKELKEAWEEENNKKFFLDIPKYQRSLVWKKNQRELFIESLKNGYPIGTILLYDNGADDSRGNKIRYSIIDGLQRITTIKKFIEEPFTFLKINNIESEYNIKIIRNALQLEDDKFDGLLEETIELWLERLTSFKQGEGYNANNLIEFLKNKLDSKIDGIIDQERLQKYLSNLLDKIRDESEIDNILLNVTIYSGEEDCLPEIFERINSRGTQLNKYEVFSASWIKHGKLNLKNKDIAEAIRKKYDKVLEEGWEVENYDGFIKECTYFEYVFGFGKFLCNKYGNLFGVSDESDNIESCGFNLLSACLIRGVKKSDTEKLPLKLISYYKDKNLELLENNILKVVEDVNDKLKGILSIKNNEKNPKVVHSEFQIISLIAKAFNIRYKENGLEEKKDEFKKIKYVKFLDNIIFHYLFDVIDDSWRGSGDKRLFRMLESEHYNSLISKEKWEGALERFFEKQMEKNEKKRTSIKDADVLFLKYIYYKTLTLSEHYDKKFHTDHIVPVTKLSKQVEKENLKGLPIGHIANICFLSKKVNKKKGSKDLIDFYEEVKREGDGEIIKELENLVIINNCDIDLIDCTRGDISSKKYKIFLRERFNILKNIFFECYNIK